MSEMTEQDAAPPESREGKRARHYKASLLNMLEEIVEVMEEARKEGFITEFNISRDPEGRYMLAPDSPALIKRW